MEKELKFNVMMKMAAGKTNKLIDDVYRIKERKRSVNSLKLR